MKSRSRSNVWSAQTTFLYLLLLVGSYVVLVPYQYTRSEVDRDAFVYYIAARDAVAGRSIYRPAYSPPDKSPAMQYLYAPWTIPVLLPLSALSAVGFMRVMLTLGLLCHLILAALLAHLSGKLTLHRWLLCALLLEAYPGTWVSIIQGQIDPLIWVAVALGVIYYRSPLAWLVAAAIKPLYIFPVLAGKFRVKQFIFPIIGALVLVIAGGFVLGWESYVFWVKNVLPALSQGNFHRHNWSIPFALVRLGVWLGVIDYHGGLLPQYVQTFLSFCSIASPLIALLVSRKMPVQKRMALTVLVAAWSAPISSAGYLVSGAPLVALLWKESEEKRMHRKNAASSALWNDNRFVVE